MLQLFCRVFFLLLASVMVPTASEAKNSCLFFFEDNQENYISLVNCKNPASSSILTYTNSILSLSEVNGGDFSLMRKQLDNAAFNGLESLIGQVLQCKIIGCASLFDSSSFGKAAVIHFIPTVEVFRERKYVRAGAIVCDGKLGLAVLQDSISSRFRLNVRHLEVVSVSDDICVAAKRVEEGMN